MDEFIRVIRDLGYSEISPLQVYTKEKLKNNKPMLFNRGEERFDIFFKQIFSFRPSNTFKKRFFARYDYKEKFTLTVYVVSKEDIVWLKALTEREVDFEDIAMITESEREIGWDIIIEEALKQESKLVKIDLEETMQKLRKLTFIKQKYFDRLY